MIAVLLMGRLARSICCRGVLVTTTNFRTEKLSLSESHVYHTGSQVRKWGRARATLLFDCTAPRHLALYSGEDRFHLVVHYCNTHALIS